MNRRWLRIFALCLAGVVMAPAHSQSGATDDLPTQSRERVWKSTGPDDGSVAALGNGKVITYEQGPDVIQLFGPPYASPTALSIRLDSSAPMESHSAREAGAAIWQHNLLQNSSPAGSMLDFVDSESPVFLRKIHASVPLRLRIHFHDQAELLQNGERYRAQGATGGMLVESPSGVPIFMNYLTHVPEQYQIVWTGNVQAEQDASKDEILTFAPGESTLAVVSGAEYPSIVRDTESLLASGADVLLKRTRWHWSKFARERTDFSPRINSRVPDRDLLLRTVDDVAVFLAAQQSATGGVIAGHNYHWYGIRDQNGTGRTLLYLGETKRARAIYDYYWDIWKRYGALHNGEGDEPQMFFHVHENDGAEIPGYLILGAFEILSATHDEAYLLKIFPMLEWAWEMQKKNLILDMMPFDGDETYVAGGLLPRSALNDGSAEATLLFYESGVKLVDWAAQHHEWTSARVAGARTVLENVRQNYRKNFWRDGRLITNNPARAEAAPMPRFRHGVCERCIAEKRFKHLTWNERTSTGRYLCPVCLAMGPYPAAPVKIYSLASVSLVPFYLHSNLISKEDLAPLVKKLANDLRTTGSFQGDDAPNVPGKIVGYDLGMLLYALTELQDPQAEAVYEKTLQMSDSTGAWAEYYINGVPHLTRCRPWESSINLEALLHYAETRGK